MINIFVTVGTQLSFERLINTVLDSLPLLKDKEVTAVIQVPNASDFRNSISNEQVTFKDIIPPKEYNDLVEKCDVLIAHAGMGSIIAALEAGKPLVLMARKTALKEHRNDHQMATLKKFSPMQGIYPIESKDELLDLLNSLDDLSKAGCGNSERRSEFCANLNKIMVDW